METKKYRYGLATRSEIAGKSGKELLQAIIDGHLPQAPISGEDIRDVRK